VPHRALGRVASWDYLTSFLAMPIGHALAGPLSRAYGINRVLTVSAAILFLSALSQLAIPGARKMTRTQTTPAAPEPAEAAVVQAG
jgi:MFS family permease